MIIEKAFAKINLYLNVINKREDGFHNLEMIMAPLALHDTLSFEKIEEKQVRINTDVEVTYNVKDNIVYKVAKYMLDIFNIEEGLEINITKRIPFAAGLAGGSADAAATLRATNELFHLNLSFDQLAEIGALFGSDVPFCVYNKMAIATSRGEKLKFINHKLNLPVLVVNPNVPVSTKEIFENLENDSISDESFQELKQAIESNNVKEICNKLYNSLEATTFKRYPIVEELKSSLIFMGLDGVLMSGSGGTVFVVNNDVEILKKAVFSLNKGYFSQLTNLL